MITEPTTVVVNEPSTVIVNNATNGDAERKANNRKDFTHEMGFIIILWTLFAVVHWALTVPAVTALVFVTGLLFAYDILGYTYNK